MAQTPIGAAKIAAKKIGVPFEDYIARVEAGEKWCSKGKHWQSRITFNKDAHRSDGLSATCRVCLLSPDPYASLRGRVSTFKGRKHTPESNEKNRQAQKDKPAPMLGKTHTLETRRKISQSRRDSVRVPRGEACHSFKDGRLAERRGQRHSSEYKRWRFDVFLRDSFTCQDCGDNKGGNLTAHHIKPFADFPELRFDVPNGITLCEDCHDKRHATWP